MLVRIRWAKGEVTGTLEDTPTARKLVEALPCSSVANTWGEEVYFAVPAQVELDKAPKQVVAPGTICFWVQGSSVAIPYGPTPVSEGSECRLVTAVNVVGKLEGDPRELASIQAGDEVTMEVA